MLEVREFRLSIGDRELLKGFNLSLAPGEVLGVIGPSGAGKTTLARALAGQRPPAVTVQGSVRVGGVEVADMDRQARSRAIVLAPQSRVGALPAYHRLGQAAEALTASDLPGLAARASLVETLTELGARDPERLARARPLDLSGGERARALLALTLLKQPKVLILDEPTSGLDQASRALVREALQAAVRRYGLALVVISHDTETLRALGGRVICLKDGEARAELLPPPLRQPTEAWPEPAAAGEPIIVVRDLSVRRGAHLALRPVSFTLRPGERLGVTGPSGAGKSTLARALTGLIPVTSGVVLRSSQRGPLTRIRAPCRSVQLLHQHPESAFDPRLTLADSIALAMVDAPRSYQDQAIRRLASDVGLAEDVMRRRPAMVSGGEAQRAAVIRALLCEPDVLVADEPTEALDPLAARAVIHVLDETVRRAGLALVLISHDPQVIGRLCERELHLSHDA